MTLFETTHLDPFHVSTHHLGGKRGWIKVWVGLSGLGWSRVREVRGKTQKKKGWGRDGYDSIRVGTS